MIRLVSFQQAHLTCATMTCVYAIYTEEHRRRQRHRNENIYQVQCRLGGEEQLPLDKI